jgi:hypothetical protein
MNDSWEGSAKGGEAAWIAARDKVAERNAKTRKAGKQEREAYERERDVRRLAHERRRSGG